MQLSPFFYPNALFFQHCILRRSKFVFLHQSYLPHSYERAFKIAVEYILIIRVIEKYGKINICKLKSSSGLYCPSLRRKSNASDRYFTSVFMIDVSAKQETSRSIRLALQIE
jgi:hypothetical protein